MALMKLCLPGSSFYDDASELIDDAFKSQAKDADKVADTMETLSEKM